MVTVQKTGVFLLRGFDTPFGAVAEAEEFNGVRGRFGTAVFADKGGMFPDPANYGVKAAVLDARSVVLTKVGGADREWAIVLTAAAEAVDVEENKAMEKADAWLALSAQKVAKVLVQ